MSEKLTRQGVRDLDHLGPRPTVKAPEPLPEAGESITDLLYDKTDEMWEEIRSTFPRARLQASWDEIHEHRTSVDIDACSERTWLKWLVRNGYAHLSLGYNLAMYRDLDLVEGIMDEVQPGWRARVKAKREGVE